MQPEMLRHADFSHFITSQSHAFFIRSQRVVTESFLRRQTSQSFHVASFLLVVFAQALLRRQKAMGS